MLTYLLIGFGAILVGCCLGYDDEPTLKEYLALAKNMRRDWIGDL